jgi:hypothetical protein
MNTVPVAGIDVAKRFSEMAILSPSNEVYARIRINHDSYTNFKRAFDRYTLGIEPTTPSDRLKLGVNSIGCQDYLFKKRAQLLLTIIHAARYTVAMLSPYFGAAGKGRVI